VSDWPGWKAGPAGAGRVPFPQAVVVEVKALACELPSEEELPFSRFSCDDIAREAVRRGIVASISGRTVWRWLHTDAIRPWLYRSWILPRDPRFAEKAGRVLDLYQGVWNGQILGPDDYVISADEKTSIQTRGRLAEGAAPAPGRTRRGMFAGPACSGSAPRRPESKRIVAWLTWSSSRNPADPPGGCSG